MPSRGGHAVDPAGAELEGTGEYREVSDGRLAYIAIAAINVHEPTIVSHIPAVEGSRINDIKVESISPSQFQGDILVHSNEACADGPGGFEIYDVRDALNPVHLASVRIDELNPIADELFGGVTDVGVHNLFIFTQGDRAFVAAVSEGVFDNFRIYEITDPADPTLVADWGAEEIFDPGVGESTD